MVSIELADVEVPQLVSEEFTQKFMCEELGMSQPVASRRLKKLIVLGLVVITKTEGVKVTGGRVKVYRRC